nr:MAG TPA: hypothetical protein [Bacteriophage sp.]
MDRREFNEYRFCQSIRSQSRSNTYQWLLG